MQVLLLTKAVLVAIYGGDDMYPTGHGGRVGLAFMFCSILCSALFAALETLLVTHFITRESCSKPVALWQHPCPDRSGAAQNGTQAGSLFMEVKMLALLSTGLAQ